MIDKKIKLMVLRNMPPQYRAMSWDDVANHVKITFSPGSMWVCVTVVGVAFAAAVGCGISCWRPHNVACNIQ